MDRSLPSRGGGTREHDDVSAPPDASAADTGAERTGPADALTRLLAELARTPDPLALAEASQRRLVPGERVGRFELLREVGRGGFGVVFEARDTELGRRVAFKAFRPGRPLDARQVEALRHEAEAAAQLNHPNVVTVHDFGNCPAGPYVIMELLRGEPLALRLEPGPLPAREALRIAAAVAQALVHAHAAGVIHRDLKPGNVFLCEDGKVKVLDFGLARLLGSGGEKGGTPGYMAPEQSRGEGEDERTDLFGLGALLYRMLTGRLPYEVVRGRSAALDPGPAPSPQGEGIPPRLAVLVRRLLERDAAARPANALEVADELSALDRLADPIGAARRRRRGVALALAILVAAVGGAAAGLGVRRLQARQAERITVAVADVENATGDPQLDGLSTLLITSLEQSRKLQVLTRSRMRDELRKLGREDAARLDETAAREVGRATGARALLLASMRRLGDVYAFELRALDPVKDQYLFAANERAASKDEVPALIDRLSERARRELHERADDVRDNSVPMGAAVTRSLEAYGHYYRGLECLERPREAWEWESCGPHFRKAIAADPEFTLAHFELARLGASVKGEPEVVQRSLAAALRGAEHAPVKERALIRALDAQVRGDAEGALARYREILARYPEEKRVHDLAGTLLWERSDYASAIPHLRAAVALDPSLEHSVRFLVHALGKLRRRDELAAQLAAWSKLPQNTALRGAKLRAAVWMGDLDGALALARENLGTSTDPGFATDLSIIQLQRGEFRDSEATLRRTLAAHPGLMRMPVKLALAVRAQGRQREADAIEEAYEASYPDPRPWARPRSRAFALAGHGPVDGLWRAILEIAETDKAQAGMFATDLAVLGQPERAAQVAAHLKTGTPDHELAEAAIAWRRGDAANARVRLRALDALEPQTESSLPVSLVLAELAAETGDDALVLEAAERFWSTWPHNDARGAWKVPRMMLLEARALARLGRTERARARLDLLIENRSGADAGDRILAEARALRAAIRGADKGAPPR